MFNILVGTDVLYVMFNVLVGLVVVTLKSVNSSHALLVYLVALKYLVTYNCVTKLGKHQFQFWA